MNTIRLTGAFFCCFSAALVASAAANEGAAKWDSRLAVNKSAVDTTGIRWIDGRALPLEGRAYDDTEHYYDRLPANVTTNVNGGVRNMKHYTSGMLFRFKTDSKTLVLKWRPWSGGAAAEKGVNGLDVYWRRGSSGWRFSCSTIRTKCGEDGFYLKRIDWEPGNECLINLPLYNGIREFSLGIDEGAAVSAARPHAVGKPVVFYGTSITQGSDASRPGLGFVNWVGRDLDVPVVGLGFAGCGRMEFEMSEHVARIDASCYVLDCLWNMNVPMLEAAYEKFIRNLRAKRPGVPIVMAGQGHVFYGGPKEHPAVTEDEIGEKHKFVRGLYERLIAEGWANLSFLPCDEMHPGNGESADDGVHPNDLGMRTMSLAYGKAVRAALESTGAFAAGALPDITATLQGEIDRAAAAGGGRVVVPAGRYGIHQILLKSNVELHLSPSAELVSLLTPAEARTSVKADPKWFLIGGEGVHKVSITGQGRINGNGYAFWKKLPGVEYQSDSPHGSHYKWIPGRPLGMIHFKDATDIVLRDVTLSDPPTYTVWLLGCDRGLIQNVRIDTDQAGPNTDGLDIDCCSSISIADCNIKAGDDAIALKSSLADLGREKACERITVRNCRLSSSYCGIRLGWEGDNVIRDCVFTDNIMHSNIGISLLTVTASQGQVKKGSPIRDIIFGNNIMDVGTAFQIRHGRYDTYPAPVASIDNVLIENTFVRTRVGSFIAGFPGNPIRNLTIRNLTMTMKDCPTDNYAENRDWVPPATDAFRVPGSAALPYGLSIHCVENFKLEGYRFVTAHPEWWLKNVKYFD